MNKMTARQRNVSREETRKNTTGNRIHQVGRMNLRNSIDSTKNPGGKNGLGRRLYFPSDIRMSSKNSSCELLYWEGSIRSFNHYLNKEGRNTLNLTVARDEEVKFSTTKRFKTVVMALPQVTKKIHQGDNFMCPVILDPDFLLDDDRFLWER